jgi:diguanylate cyclase (GGDEF)-like protein
LKTAHKQLKEHSLPLSLDNIYTEIQKNIVEPYLVSSMMANDTFVQDWILKEEKNGDKIQKYLDAIKNKYSMFNTFLVSDKTKNYYTQNGFIEQIKKENPANGWYFRFKESQDNHEINLDFNNHMSNELIMFINYKIFDPNFHFIGATGVALKISYIDDMLKKFRQKHNFIVTFFNPKGEIVLAEKDIHSFKNINEMDHLKVYKDTIISKQSEIIEYSKKGNDYILNTKYIPELNLYLTVQVKVDKYIQDVKNIFYFNLIASLVISLIVVSIVFFIIRKNNKQLEYLADHDPLTETLNRRSFEKKLEDLIVLHQRNDLPLCVCFVDLDNFKLINDKHGHNIGNQTLKEFSVLMKNNLRQTDLLARWGGEEFVIVLVDSSLEDAAMKIEKLRALVENSKSTQNLLQGEKLTASFGLTMFHETDTLDTLTKRADEAMYYSKNNGKNQITTL